MEEDTDLRSEWLVNNIPDKRHVIITGESVDQAGAVNLWHALISLARTSTVQDGSLISFRVICGKNKKSYEIRAVLTKRDMPFSMTIAPAHLPHLSSYNAHYVTKPSTRFSVVMSKCLRCETFERAKQTPIEL